MSEDAFLTGTSHAIKLQRHRPLGLETHRIGAVGAGLAPRIIAAMSHTTVAPSALA